MKTKSVEMGECRPGPHREKSEQVRSARCLRGPQAHFATSPDHLPDFPCFGPVSGKQHLNSN